MALRIDASSEHAHAPNPWAGGAFTIAFWMYRLGGATTTRFLTGLLDTDDSTPEATGDPRVTLGTTSGSALVGSYTGNGASTNDTTTATYSTSAWTHVAVVYTSSGGSTLTSVEVYVNGSGTGSPGSASRDLSVNGVLDRLQIGSNTANHSNCDFAHWAYFDTALSGSQITELQTKLPSAITGATPVIYCPLLADALNDGSGGSTYDLTLSGAALNSTNDGSLPSLSGGGTSPVQQDFTASRSVYGVVQQDFTASRTINSATSVSADFTAARNVLAAVQQDFTAARSIVASGDIRLQFGLERERGALAASLTGIEWWVFGSDRSEYAHGTGLALDSNGVGYVDLDGSPFAVGDRVLVAVMTETAEAERLDRTVRSGIFYVPAIAQA